MQILSKYSPWQIEMAVTASLLKLGMLTDRQIVEYTHYLLDNEYYDDEMLSIIDDNLEDVEGFTNALYCVDEAVGDVYMGYVQNGYNDPKTILAMKTRFFDLCRQWLNRNQNNIESIFATLYP